MIKVKDLEDIGADSIIISGGMKRFVGCDDNDGSVSYTHLTLPTKA